MKIKVSVSERGVITIPSALRRELGLNGNDEFIIERCSEGILLRPSFSVALEFHTAKHMNNSGGEEDNS